MHDLRDALDQKWLFDVVKKNFFSIPISVRIISLSSFLFVLWRGLWADTFFSLYVKTILDNILWVAMIWWLVSFIRLFFTIPIWKLNDHADIKSIIFLSKFFFAIAWILYFFAGLLGSISILIIAVIFNWFASATLFTTFNSYLRHWINKNHSWSAFGLFFSSLNFAYVVWALISVSFINLIDLKYVFLFIALFSIISFFTDRHLPDIRKKKKLHIFLKQSFLRQFVRGVFSLQSFKDTRNDLKASSSSVFSGLKFEFLFGALNYIGFLFIPIISFQNNLSLAEIAIIFAIMRVPYIIDLVLGGISDKFNKKWFILFVLLIVSFLYSILGFMHWFLPIVIISFGISMGLAIIRPVISSLTSEDWNKKIIWSITGAEQFMWRLGDVAGAIIFGVVSSIFSGKIAFIVIGALLFIFSFMQLFKKFIMKRK